MSRERKLKMKQILKHFYELQPEQESAKKLTTGRLEAHTKPIESYKELLDEINNFLPADGWISYQSEVAQFLNMQKLPEESNEVGKVLQAEFVQVADNKKSLHIRQNGNGGWTTSFISETESTDAETGVLEKSQFITMPPKASQGENGKGTKEGKLYYQTYWELHELDENQEEGTSQQGYQKTLSRLAKLEINEATVTSVVKNDEEKSNAST